MSTISAPALSTIDVTFAAAAPGRPSRSARKRGGAATLARNLIRVLRRELSHATVRQATDWMPRLSQYPY